MVNRSPHPGIIPQSPWLQLPASVDTSGLTTLSEVWKLQHGLSMWFSLCSDCHRLVSSLSNCFKCVPHPSGWPWMQGSLPWASAPSSPGAGWSPALFLLSPSSLSLLSFVLPSSVWIWIFLLSTQGLLPVLTWSSVGTAVSLDILDTPWREVNPTSTYRSVILSTPICACIRNEFPCLLSNTAITTHV